MSDKVQCLVTGGETGTKSSLQHPLVSEGEGDAVRARSTRMRTLVTCLKNRDRRRVGRGGCPRGVVLIADVFGRVPRDGRLPWGFGRCE